MITIGDKTIKESSVIQTVDECEKEVNIEFEKDGVLDWDFNIVITYREDRNGKDKELVSIKVDDKVSDTSNVSEHYDMGEDLSITIDTVIEKQFPEESQETRNDWARQVEETICKALDKEGLEI